MRLSTPLICASGALAATSGSDVEARQSESCAKLHIFGAREWLVPQGFGHESVLIEKIQEAYPGATSEAIVYPASPRGDAYPSSVTAGIQAVVDQVTTYATQCPDSSIVMVGYSEGSQIMDDAFCGGPDGNSMAETSAPIPTAVGERVKALVFMGDPRNIPGAPYNIGSSTGGGFAQRPVGYVCPVYADRIRSYCDAEDPYCSNGNNVRHHEQYVMIYGEHALAFVREKVGSL
ncbi:carbohydrate esterase family 5 protein [Hypoxylon rubiginosum]|uniref:Carbohydrate esterase family 5 protein n=1 Tax=Hypoxylon rubiginosum TaxID=110542 RepID=A0ACC0DCT6_9PEZI|nr:carbohydrate esterase family 5 protein [Hypoxylon rubiginosum]